MSHSSQSAKLPLQFSKNRNQESSAVQRCLPELVLRQLRILNRRGGNRELDHLEHPRLTDSPCLIAASSYMQPKCCTSTYLCIPGRAAEAIHSPQRTKLTDFWKPYWRVGSKKNMRKLYLHIPRGIIEVRKRQRARKKHKVFCACFWSCLVFVPNIFSVVNSLENGA